MAGRIKSIKITMNPTAKRTRDFPDSSAVKVKVKFTLEQATKNQMGSTDIVLHFL